MRTVQSVIEGFGSCTNNEISSDDPTAHVTVDHEGQSTEDLLYDLVIAVK
jgi:hypothetical protein